MLQLRTILFLFGLIAAASTVTGCIGYGHYGYGHHWHYAHGRGHGRW